MRRSERTTTAFAALLLPAEAASSSRIEDLTSSAKAIARAESGRKGRENAGRALLHAMLGRRALARRLIAPVSAGLLGDTPTSLSALEKFWARDPVGLVEEVAHDAQLAIDRLADDGILSQIGNGRRRPATCSKRWSACLPVSPSYAPTGAGLAGANATRTASCRRRIAGNSTTTRSSRARASSRTLEFALLGRARRI